MIICVCHHVSDRDIARSVLAGADSFEVLQAELAVATGCGKCHDCAQASFHELRAADADRITLSPAPARAGLPGAPLTSVPVRVLRRLVPATLPPLSQQTA